jgi:hypothetical protein
MGDDLLCRRILDLEGLASLGLKPFAVDPGKNFWFT